MTNDLYKRENWITDKLGYRNDTFVQEADILFIGDSFIAGSGLSQDQTISSKVKTIAAASGKKCRCCHNSYPENL